MEHLKYTTVKEIAGKWGVSAVCVYGLLSKGRISGAKKDGRSWYIPVDAEYPSEKIMDPKPGYISTKEAAEKWGICWEAVCEAAREGRIPGAEFGGGRWHIPKDLDAPEKRKRENKERIKYLPGYTSILKTAEKWGISYQRVLQLCEENRVSGAVYENKHWNIPMDAEKPLRKNITPGFLSATDTAKKWSVSVDKVIWMCQNGVLLGAKRCGKTWLIPYGTVNPLEGFLPVFKTAENWGMDRVSVARCCKEGRIFGAKQVGRNWYIPVDAKKPRDGKADRKPGFTSASEMARRWGTSRNFVCKAAKEGLILGAEQIDGYWHIPEDAKYPLKEKKSVDERTEQKTHYLTALQMAERWATSPLFVKKAARNGRIPGAKNSGNGWRIPEDAVYPGSERQGKDGI